MVNKINKKKSEGNANLGSGKIGILFCIMFVFFMGLQTEALAEQNQELKQGTLVNLLQDADMHEEPNEASTVLFSFRKGDAVFKTGEPENGWCPVMFHMINGYIKVSGEDCINDATGQVSENTESNNADINNGKADQAEDGILELYADKKTIEEMAILDNQMNNFGTEVELDRKHRRESRIWGAIIVLLIFAFIGSSVLPTLKEQKKLKEQKDGLDENILEDLEKSDLTRDEITEN